MDMEVCETQETQPPDLFDQEDRRKRDRGHPIQCRSLDDLEYRLGRSLDTKLKLGTDRMDGLDLRIEEQGLLLKQNTTDTSEIVEILRSAKGFFSAATKIGKFFRICAIFMTPFVTLYLAFKYGKLPEK